MDAGGAGRQIESIREIIRGNDGFILTGHTNPDSDAIGSCYALALALEKMGKSCSVALESYAPKFDMLPGRHLRFAGKVKKLQPDVLFCLDCADENRLGEAKKLIERARVTVCIDHHVTNTGFAQYNYLDGEASSTSELVFRLLDGMTELDRDIASCIYAGLVGDTGGFRFSATSHNTLNIAAQLMAHGIPFTDIYTGLSLQHTFTEVKLFGRALNVCERYFNERAVCACVTREMMNESKASGQDLDGVVEYLLNIRGAEVAALLYDKNKTEVKVSLRSQNKVDVSVIAAAFGGGGHRQAAGCTVKGPIDEIKARVLAAVEQALGDA